MAKLLDILTVKYKKFDIKKEFLKKEKSDEKEERKKISKKNYRFFK